ncbi:MAG: hypothetical protein HW378_3768 [Anaerolineales bacterium]|nr:hypothetical protein [Anaerolineales bacterium]
MWRKTFRGRWRAWRALRWPVRLGLPIVFSLSTALVAWAIVTDLAVVRRVHTSAFPNHVDQAELVGEGFTEAFEEGDELFETRFNAVDGVGANVGNGKRFSRFPRADLRGPGQWFNHTPARITGPNAQACNACHSDPMDDGAGGPNNDAVRDPLRNGNVAEFIERNAPALFGLGALQRLAEETTVALQNIRQNAIDSACRNGSASRPLTAQGISFGTLKVTRTERSPCKTNVDTSGVKGVAPDLIVRPFQWKGSVAFVRDFVRGAGHNELGMQGVEMAGADVDGDFDGVVNELTVGDITALTLYQAAQPRPTTLLELMQLGLIEPLPQEQVNAINRGSSVFAQIGCTSCHVPTLKIGNPIFSEPSQNPDYRDTTFPAGQNPAALGLDPAAPITFDLTKDQPDNVIDTANGTIHLGSFKVGSDGQALVDLYGDLKRHDLGPGLAEPIADDGVPNSVFMTENLWGVGSTAPYLHDGRATTLAEAILEHGGEGAASRDHFKKLSGGDQQAVVAFLNNLVLFKNEEAGAPPEPTQPPPSTNTPNPTATPTNTPGDVTATPTQPDVATPTPTETPAATLPPSALNLALNKPATADSQCNENEGPAKAADGSTSTKWCSRGRAKWLQVDLGAEFSVTRFVIKHAGAGGERRSFNTRDFNIQVSTDGANWNTVVRVRNNTASVTTHDISATAARYVRLNITDPEQGRGGEARIYELEVYALGGDTAPTPAQADTPIGAAETPDQAATPTPAPTDAPPSETNLALNKPATADSQCSANEGPAKAVNGSVSGGDGDKWCSRGETKWLQVDLGANNTVARFVVKHAEAGGERSSGNTRDFNIQVSGDGVNWTTVVTVTGNTASTTTHTITATTARYVRLNVTAPQQNGRGAARIYELEVYGN